MLTRSLESREGGCKEADVPCEVLPRFCEEHAVLGLFGAVVGVAGLRDSIFVENYEET
jgi:hypothetical protein